MPTGIKYEEAALLALLSEDNEYAFQLLFDKYSNKVYRIAMLYVKSPVIAEDIVQDIFIKLWFQRKDLYKKSSIESWIYVLTRNHTINALKKLAREWAEAEKWTETITQTEHISADHTIRTKEDHALLAQAIKKLPVQQQKVYLLVKEKGLSYEAIARELSLSLSTVKTHMTRALTSIRSSLRRDGIYLWYFKAFLPFLI